MTKRAKSVSKRKPKLKIYLSTYKVENLVLVDALLPPWIVDKIVRMLATT